jgi:hypothetical protein
MSDGQLRVADRCDACGSQAFVSAHFWPGRLLFCGHHYARHKDALRRVALMVDDQRWRINERPSPSASV